MKRDKEFDREESSASMIIAAVIIFITLCIIDYLLIF